MRLSAWPILIVLLLGGAGGLALWLGVFTAPREDHSATAAAPPWFTDITREAGLDFVHDPGPTGTYFMPQIMGSGAALLDFDQDKRLDIYLLHNAGPDAAATNRLYRQLPGGRFQDVSKGSGLDIHGYNMGVAVGDVNNDGWPDVLVTQYEGLKLFLNQGNGTFFDVTAQAGLDSTLWGTSAAFFDYNRDGRLDLVVADYIDYDPAFQPCYTGAHGKPEFCGPQQFPGTVSKLYRNDTPPGTVRAEAVRFQDVTLAAGLAKATGAGLGVLCDDFDDDGWPDIFIANDARPNHLWINQRDGTFREEAVQRGLAFNGMGRTQANMGIAQGDVDGDGLFDLFSTHMTEELHTLWRQQVPGQFTDQTAAAGLSRPRWRGTGFGTVLADVDQDGAEDLAIVNGRIARGQDANPDLGAFWSGYAERNQLFRNDGSGRFQDISLANDPFCATPWVSRGLACGDIDNDGSLDLLVTLIGESAHLFRNVASQRGHWLMVQAIDPALHRDAYGARITIQAGTRRQSRLINPAYSYLCSNDPRAHFGLGQAATVDAIEVLWPDGVRERFAGGPVDRTLILRKGDGQAIRPDPGKKTQ
jgi:hypothetical protein